MLFAKVTKIEQKEIKEAMKESENKKWYRRLKIIDLSSERMRVPELAKMFDLSQATVRTYIKKYNEQGLEELRPKKNSGRQAKIGLTKQEWEDLFQRSPHQYEQLNTETRNWSQELVQAYLKQYHEVTVSQGTISTTLKRLGISWTRTKKKSPHQTQSMWSRSRG